MIISHSHKFCFVHIPKCAGTTARKALEKHNEWEHAGPPWVRNHEALGEIDYGHIPLFTLRDFFNDDFETVKTLSSFAIIRDPFDRFASSVSQRLKMYNSHSIFELGPKEFRSVIQENIDFLSDQPKFEHLLPVEYAHFQKQIDYLYVNGEKIVKSIYPADDLYQMFTHIEKITGEKLDFRSHRGNTVRTEGKTRVIRNDTLKWVVKLARLLNLNKYISSNLKHKLLHPISLPRNERMQSIFSEPYVQDFIKNYYREDIALYKKSKSQSLLIK